ncbi:unnamed protein product [Ilex paraguariensis]|uniref:Uncharacterized protein n=1 Tax=Ilex paraguariensis TaxID=185542 RepID=A0ABC8SI96_9AQUA
MIHLCTCTGGSASITGLSKRRAATASCKTCGRRPSADGTESPASSVINTVGLELTSLISSDLTWKVSKGNRSSLRRARTSLQSRWELANKEFKEVEMPVSESEKLGVSVLGCRFSEKAEHVPIKKRRFFFRSPSPPLRTTSSRSEETERLTNSQHASGQGFLMNPLLKCKSAASASAVDISQVVDSNQKFEGTKSAMLNERIGENDDFSGISILAAAACSNSLGDIEEGSGVESPVREGPIQVLLNDEAKEDLVNSGQISTEGTGSFISTVPPEGAASLRMYNSSPKRLSLENTSESSLLQNNSMVGSQGLSNKKDDGTARIQEFSARDDRLHWDLNTVMDAWESPFDDHHSSDLTNAADLQPDCANEGNLEGNGFQKEFGVTNEDTGKAQVLDESSNLSHETQDLNKDEHKSPVCTDINMGSTLQANLQSSETDNPLNVVMDFVKEANCLPNKEKFCTNDGSLALPPPKDVPDHCTSPIVDKHATSRNVNFSSKTREVLSSVPVAGVDSSLHYSMPPTADILNSTCLSEGTCNAAATGFGSAKSVDDCGADVQTCGTISPTYQVEKQNASVRSVPYSDKAACEIGNSGYEDCGNANNISGSGDNGNSAKDRASMETDHLLGNELLDGSKENAGLELDGGGFWQSSRTHVEVPTSDAFLEGQSVVESRNKVQRCKVTSGHDTSDSDMQMQVYTEKPESTTFLGKPIRPPHCLSSPYMQRSCSNDFVSGSGKVTLEEQLDDGYASDVSRGDRHPRVGIDKENELQLDYDSQYEDGELRDSSIHSWEGYDGEDGETERLDYGSDNRDSDNLGSEKAQESNLQSSPGGSSRKKSDSGPGRGSFVNTRTPCLRVQKVDSSDKGSGSGTEDVTRNKEDHDMRDHVKELSESAELKVNMSGSDLMPEISKHSSDIKTRVRAERVMKCSAGNQRGRLGAEYAGTKADESRAHGRDWPSRIERTTSQSAHLRRERSCMQGSSSNDAYYSNPRSERESGAHKSFGRGRYFLQSHTRSREGGHWADFEGYRGLKRHRSPTYHGPTAFHRSRLENVALDGTNTKEEGAGQRVTGRQTVTDSHIIHRPFRSGSPNDRQEAFRMRLGFRPAREMSPGRSATMGRGRSVRYGARMDGGPRRRYYGGANDDFVESSLDYSHSSARRRRSFSPAEKRGIPHARRSNSKSPSRSRTRSPIAWQSPRRRTGDGAIGILGFKNRSRFNCRSDTRMPRVRSPHIRSGFAADHLTSFSSVPRGNDSPPPNSRCIGYNHRSSALDRSPGRIGSREDRFDLLDPPRKLKPNEYYRSVNPGRFSESNGAGRGRSQYEGNDDDHKQEYRYGLVHRARRYDMDRTVKRFRYEDEDGYILANGSRNKDSTDFHGRENPKAYSGGIDSSIGDQPRSSREDRGPFVYRRDGRYNANSKVFGVREGDEDEASRRRRPS